MSVAAQAPAGARAGVDRRAMTILSAGHMLTDVGQGSIPALLPFLMVRDNLNFATASLLILAATISSSVIQPFFGYFSDRRSLPWLMPLGPFLGGLGVALVGVAPSYGATFGAVLIAGVGVAAFHPEASRFANYVSGSRRSSGMSLFSVGGNIGFALGPALVTPLVLVFGLHGTLLLIVPTWVMGTVLVRALPRLSSFRPEPVAHAAAGDRPADAWGPFALLGVVIALRSFVYFGFVTFIPLYYVHVLHAGKATGGAALTAMLVGGAVGTLAGGPLADRFGRRTVLVGSMLMLPGLIVGFLLSGPALAIVFAVLAGAATVATFAVTIVIGQELLPARIGVASGVTIGLSIGLGGVGAPLLGILGDAHGLRAVFELLVAFPIAAALMSIWLPATGRHAGSPGPDASARQACAGSSAGTLTSL